MNACICMQVLQAMKTLEIKSNQLILSANYRFKNKNLTFTLFKEERFLITELNQIYSLKFSYIDHY